MNKRKITQLIAAALIINSLSNVTVTATTTTNSNTEVSATADSTTEYSAVHNVSTTDELNSALADATEGQIIMLATGSYGDITIPVGKTIILQGASTEAKLGQVTVNNANLTLRNVTVETNKYGIYAPAKANLDIQDCIFNITPNSSTNNTGIMTQGAINENSNGTITIKNNVFNMNGMRGIQLYSSNSATVEGNTFNMKNSDGTKSTQYAVQLAVQPTEFTFNRNTVNDARHGVYVHLDTQNTNINFGTNTFNNTSFDYSVRPQAVNNGTTVITGDYGYWLSPSAVGNTDNGLDAIPSGSRVHMAGTYNTNLTVNKSLTLIGEDKNTTVLNGKITASADAIANLNISNITINADNQHLALWQNTNVQAVNVDNVIFNHLLSANQATMYFWGTQEVGGYDLISITNSEFNYPNAGTGSDVANVDGEIVDRAFVGQTYDAKKIVFSNNKVNVDGKATIRKGFELSGAVDEFTAENNIFDKTRNSLFAWLTDTSKDAIFNVNNNEFNNSTTAGFAVDAWTGDVLGALNATGNIFNNCTDEISIPEYVEIHLGNMATGADEDFGDDGNVTPEVDRPEFDGSGEDNYLTPNQPVGDGSAEDNMQVVPEDSPSLDPEDENGTLPETDVTPEDEPSFDLEDETLPNTGGTAASYALGLGGLITAMGAALFRKKK